MRELIIIRGAGDLASGVSHRLKKGGFRVIMLEIEKPTVIRKTVSFATAVFAGEAEIEGIKAVKADTYQEAAALSRTNIIPVLIDPTGESIKALKPDGVVDCILAKKNLGTNIHMAPAVVAAGPGFTAGIDAHAVVETNRGHYLGRVIWDGSAEPNTGTPGDIGGYSKERLIKAPAQGRVRIIRDIGSMVKAGDPLCEIEGKYALAAIDGLVRGMIIDGSQVYEGMKIGDVDPRGSKIDYRTISDKARAIGGGVLEALLSIFDRRDMDA